MKKLAISLLLVLVIVVPCGAADDEDHSKYVMAGVNIGLYCMTEAVIEYIHTGKLPETNEIMACINSLMEQAKEAGYACEEK
jgi:hypothetical protein